MRNLKPTILAACAEIEGIKPTAPKTKEYRLMYLFGAWVTSSKIYAETDEEAIFDADDEPRKAADELPYALFCGRRLVKLYDCPAMMNDNGRWRKVTDWIADIHKQH